jgi:hypothetical protein
MPSFVAISLPNLSASAPPLAAKPRARGGPSWNPSFSIKNPTPFGLSTAPPNMAFVVSIKPFASRTPCDQFVIWF